MKLEFTNLGALDCGILEVNDLTVICGENNTGKTYLTYTLYALLKRWEQFIHLPTLDLTSLYENGVLEIDTDAILQDSSSIVQSMLALVSAKIHVDNCLLWIG